MGVSRASGWPCFVITIPSGGRSSNRERMRRRTSVAFSFIFGVYIVVYMAWVCRMRSGWGRYSAGADMGCVSEVGVRPFARHSAALPQLRSAPSAPCSTSSPSSEYAYLEEPPASAARPQPDPFSIIHFAIANRVSSGGARGPRHAATHVSGPYWRRRQRRISPHHRLHCS